MIPRAEPDWYHAYRDIGARMQRAAAQSRLILCGCCTCIDRLLTLQQAVPVLVSSPDPDAMLLGRELLRRAEAGLGGELLWRSAAAATLLEQLDARSSLGGTAAQASYALAQLGAPVLLAVQDRTAEQVGLLHPDILIATEDRLARAGTLIPPHVRGRPPHFIIEYIEGRPVAGVVPRRSTRVIVRFSDDGMDHDPCFIRASARLASEAACGILAGLNAIPDDELAATLANASALAKSWRTAGLAVIHLELADFPNSSHRQAAIAALTGHITSLGMNYNELNALLTGAAPVNAKARHLAETLNLNRVTIHADEWALTVTRGDPPREQLALLAGCLLAANRAAHGRPIVPSALPQGASFHLPYPAIAEEGGWYTIACPAPWLPRPASTVGLGDTFVAGTMLMLGRICGEIQEEPRTP
jgi:ADP-dependent phosphofructokinase/glucokinase